MIDAPASPALAELAARCGVSTEFTDWKGDRREIGADTLRAVLAALDVDASTEEAVQAALLDTELDPWRRTLPASVVQRAGEPKLVSVHVPHGAQVVVDARLEDGSVRSIPQIEFWVDPREVDGILTGRATFELPGDLPKGWHTLEARVRHGEELGAAEGTLIVAPSRLEAQAALDPTPRMGLMAQAYQLRSAASWGIGDLHDVATLAHWGAAQGADFLLVNPIHAPVPVPPIEPSPYLPTTRRFSDPMLLRIEDIPGARLLGEEESRRLAQLAGDIRAQNQADRIDRDAVWLAKREALALVFPADLSDDERRRAFGEFCEREGQSLVDFATFCAIAGVHGPIWTGWPEELRHPESEAVAAFRDEHDVEVDFFRWLQWVLEEQLVETQRRAVESGMALGLVHDLAVGVHPSGADSWALPTALARGVSVGAPPDMFNQLGQNWSQPPLRPDRLAELGYAPYREMLRAAFKAAGGLRIDHILGFFRLWWIPQGASPDQGAYVQCDHEALLGILALEAERANAVVIGEDMGVVAPHVRSTLLERGIDGTSVLWFEWGQDDSPLAPEAYRERCLASVTTHDLPPTAGYLALEHVDLRARLGLLTISVEQEQARERAVIDRVVQALVDRGLAAPDAGERELVLGLHRYLAQSSARFFGVSVADLAGDRRSVNQPGTYREYPNWSVPLSDEQGRLVLLGDLVRSEWARELAAASKRG
ncbi:4-alpha-glucanotransferase [Pseudoclavibacter triregionum]|nr:4-alpha-glucanotransferase [Pseudoclavibacter triregionum]